LDPGGDLGSIDECDEDEFDLAEVEDVFLSTLGRTQPSGVAGPRIVFSTDSSGALLDRECPE
jgi:hypothetical protein